MSKNFSLQGEICIFIVNFCNEKLCNIKDVRKLTVNHGATIGFYFAQYRFVSKYREKENHMGMASSQARLLHLTGRMHQIEYKAQKLEAQKLQLANDSRRVYEDYLRVLDAQKVQFSALNSDGSITFLDATLAALENRTVTDYTGVTSRKTYLLQDASTNKIYLTESFARQWGIQGTSSTNTLGTLEEYIDANKSKIPTKPKKVEVDNWEDIKSVTPVENHPVSSYNPDKVVGTTWTVSEGPIDAPRPGSEIGSFSLKNGNTITPATEDITTKQTGGIGDIVVNPATPHYDQVVGAGSKVNNAASVPGESEPISAPQTTYTLPDTYTWKGSSSTTFGYTDGQVHPPITMSTTLEEIANEYLKSCLPGTTPDYVYNNSFIKLQKSNLNSNGTLSYAITDSIYLNDPTLTVADVVSMLNSAQGITERNDNGIENIANNITADCSGIGGLIFNTRNMNTNVRPSIGFHVGTSLYTYANSNTSGEWAFKFKNKGDGTVIDISYGDFLSGKNQENITYGQYFEWLKDNHPELGFTWEYVDGIIKLNVNSDIEIEAPGPMSITPDEQEKVPSHTINAKDFARNIDIALAIKNETKADGYAPVGALADQMTNSRSNGAKRIIVMMNDALNNLLNQSNPNKEALQYIHDAFIAYVSGTTSSDTVINNLEGYGLIDAADYPEDDVYIIDESSENNFNIVPVQSSTQNGWDKGSVTNVPTNNDMLRYFAYEMSQSSGADIDYEAYLAELQGRGYSNYELADLYYNAKKDSAANKSAVINALKSNNVTAFTADVTDWENIDMYNPMDQSATPNYFVTETKTLNTETKDEILQQIAFDLYQKGYVTNPIDTYGDLQTTYSTMTEAQAASLSSYYGNVSTWNEILSKVANNESIDSYLTKFNRTYNSIEDSGKTVEIVENNGTPYVEMDTVSDIATRLAGDIYKKEQAANPDTTMNPNTVKSTIEGFGKKVLASLSFYYSNLNEWDDIVNALHTNLSVSSVSEWAQEYDDINDFRVTGTNNLSITSSDKKEEEKGFVEIPTNEGIASNFLEAFRHAGLIATNSEVTADYFSEKLGNKFSEDQDSLEKLANINELVVKYLKNNTNAGDITNIYNYLTGNSSTLTLSETVWDKNKYDFDQKYLGECDIRYNQKEIDDPSGATEMDTDSQAYKDLVNQYYVAKGMEGYDIEIIPDDDKRAYSYEFVANFSQSNMGVYIEFDPEKFNGSDALKEMSHTNISVETSLREVDDEKELRKAEAKYEADMRQIDKKDRKYDYDLAALENERNAIKNEMETLKTVAGDNVDRTFKLFS